MEKAVVVYQSKYGYTKKYAEWIAQRLTCPLFEASKINADSLLSYHTIIFGGGLYGGGINGIKLITKNYEKLQGKNIVIFTVGISDPAMTEQFEPDRNLTHPMNTAVKTFHFRGGMDFSRLNIAHKLAIIMLRNMLKKKKDKTEGELLLLSYFSVNADFTDESSTLPLISYCLNQTN